MLLLDYCLCGKKLNISGDTFKFCPDPQCKCIMAIISSRTMKDNIVDFFVGKIRVIINYEEKAAQINWHYSTDFDCLLNITTVEEMKEKLNFILTFL